MTDNDSEILLRLEKVLEESRKLRVRVSWLEYRLAYQTLKVIDWDAEAAPESRAGG